MKIFNVVAGIYKKEDKVLAFKRSGNAKFLPNFWEFPGGKIEKGETDIETLKRELKEEINVDANILEFIFKDEYIYDFGLVKISFYFCSYDEKQISLNVHDEIKWISKENWNNVKWAPADINFVKKIFKID